MPCYKPLKAWVSDEPNDNGKFPLTWDIRRANPHAGIVDVPCGQCIGCKLERSRQWAIRCVHEASLYDQNCFITLTYDEVNVPVNGSLIKSDFQKFMKRLRKRIGSKVRFFHCGEYGEKNSRPHYHACLFGYDFPDKELWSVRGDVKLYRSASLEDLWRFGISTVGDVNFNSAAYVARYVTKKVTGDPAEAHYKGRVPEYVTMSRRPGIAYDWYKKFSSDVYPDDFVVIRDGVKCRPPKYYDALYDLDDSESHDILKAKRKERAVNNPHNAWKRLKVREKLKWLKLKQLRRGYETQSV